MSPMASTQVTFEDDPNPESVRWDNEWLVYLSTEAARPHFRRYDTLGAPRNLAGIPRSSMWDSELCVGAGAANIWVDGDTLVGARVLEVGCGCGYLGKQLGLICDAYVGVDHSPLAIHIARLTSPSNCQYALTHNIGVLHPLHGTLGIMLGRHFFIHQNLASAIAVLRLARVFLVEGAKVYADFFLPPKKHGTARVLRAMDDLDPSAPSAGFCFSDSEIETLADQSGYTVSCIEDAPSVFRRFALLVRA